MRRGEGLPRPPLEGASMRENAGLRKRRAARQLPLDKAAGQL